MAQVDVLILHSSASQFSSQLRVALSYIINLWEMNDSECSMQFLKMENNLSQDSEKVVEFLTKGGLDRKRFKIKRPFSQFEALEKLLIYTQIWLAPNKDYSMQLSMFSRSQ